MHPSIWLVLAVSLVGDVIVFFSSTLLLAHQKTVDWLSKYATPFAAGALLAAAFLDFLHDGVEQYDPLQVLTAALVGVIFFFLLEGWLHWFHHHSLEPFEQKGAHKEHAEPITALATGGNWLHNFIDGAAIAAAFLVSTSTGVVTTLAVALHEIPREMADSGYLLKRGMKRKGVIMVHGVAIVVTAIGTLLFYMTARTNTTLLAWLLGSTAGFFIYIAASDIIPSINRSRTKPQLFDLQAALVILGAALVGSVIVAAHHFIG
jgi:zinc and cadmium transporter